MVNNMLKKMLVLFLLIVLIVPSQTFATGTIDGDEKQVINFSTALELALEKDSSIDNLNDTLDKLWEKHNDMVLLSRSIQSQLDTLARFEELHKKETRTQREQFEYMSYQKVFGERPPVFTGQEMLDKFIKPRDLVHFQVYYEHQKLKNTRDTIDDSLEMGLLTLYIQTLNLKEMYEAQTFYTDVQQVLLNNTSKRYQEGLTSESDYNNSQKNYQIAVLQLKQLERNLNNITYQLNNLMGLPYESVVTLSSDFLKPAFFEEKGYATYYAIALENRKEIANAQMDYDYKVRENRTYKEYLKNDLYTDNITSDTDLFEAETKLTDAKRLLEAEIYEAYYDVLAKKEDYKMLAVQLNNEKEKYNNMVRLYESGMIKQTDLDMNKYLLMLSENKLNAAYRAYNEAVMKFKKAIDEGPGYSMGGTINAN